MYFIPLLFNQIANEKSVLLLISIPKDGAEINSVFVRKFGYTYICFDAWTNFEYFYWNALSLKETLFRFRFAIGSYSSYGYSRFTIIFRELE